MTETAKAVFKAHIRAPIQTVWDELTKAGETLPFFFGSVLDTPGLAPGAPIRMRTSDGKYTGVVGDVLVFEPPYRYSHTFKFTHVDDPPCRVTYELKEVEGGVEFTLIAEDMPKGTKTEKNMVQGGEFITKTLKALVETGKLPLKSRLILFLCWATKPLTPNRCASVNWPFDRKVEPLEPTPTVGNP
jgi:uncharacterized protein YndB with AHSA1/START domain